MARALRCRAASRWRSSPAWVSPRAFHSRAIGLADLIWAGRGEQADVSLRQELARLRRALGEDALPSGAAVAQPVRINPEQIDIDVARFRSAAGAAGGASEALTLYRGPLLEDFPLRPNEPLGQWFGGHREHLHDIARALMLRLLRSGEGSQALAERLIELDPLCEEGYRFLIRRFAAEGDLAGAQRRYEACANAFAAAGLETSLEIRALMDDARAEIASASAGAFQAAHPAAATQATHWLRAALGQPSPLRRPEPRFVPEIADRPSIAVLPFDDLSEISAPRDPYLGDFVTEEITAALSRIRGLFVCARHSASAYRGVPKDARLIAGEPSVRYLVEGAISGSASALRCNVRLIDGRTGLHIWADRVEAPGGARRELRDRIVSETAARLTPRVLIAEVLRESEQREPPRDAYAALMRAKAELLRELSYAENLTRALAAARAAVALDPASGEAHAMIAYLLTLLSWSRMSAQPLRDSWRARRHLREALKLSVGGGSALAMCSETALIGANDIDHALALAEEAVRGEPEDAHALALLGHIRRMAGEGSARLDRACRARAAPQSARPPHVSLAPLCPRVPLEARRDGRDGSGRPSLDRALCEHPVELDGTRAGARLAGAAR
jgi:TolB-like protein/DNA-binding SARP family transcriptional activator